MKIHILTGELILSAVVVDNIINVVRVILRMDGIDTLGGMAVTTDTIQFNELQGDMLLMCSLLAEADDSLDQKLCITNRDFLADFNRDSWTVIWR